MSDKELLKLAAKAACIQIGRYAELIDDYYSEWNGQSAYELTTGGYWNPLEDDGDALRLAASLNLCVCFTLAEANPTFGTAMVGYSPLENKVPIATERYSEPSEKLAATRRAIVKAAAEIGKAMP